MKRNAGAQAGESKLESRFAALTSGLLARKGFAAPSNSPIEDPAEETVAFTLEPTRKGDKKKDAAAPKAAPKAMPKPPAELKSAAKEVNAGKPSQPEKAPEKAPEKPVEKRVEKQVEKQTDKKQEPAAKAQPAQEIKLRASERAEPEPLKVINERSMEAGYPDNPSPEEIAALEAEADEVVSYFEKFGSDDAVKLEKSDFYGDDAVAEDDDEVEADAEADADDILDELDDLDDLEDEVDEPFAKEGTTVAGPWAGASVPPVAAATEVKAGVTVQLTAREFMRLSLGAAELAQPAQELIVEAIEEYLDARGVLSLGGCSCLEALTKKPGDM